MNRRLLTLAVPVALAASGAVFARPAQPVPQSAESVALSEPLEARIFPLFQHLRGSSALARMIQSDPELRALMAERDARITAAPGCVPQPLCRADAWIWTAADLARTEGALRRLAAADPKATMRLARHMRRSGAFNRHAMLGDSDLIVAAWLDAARGINRLVAIYAKGEAPRYPKIDAIIFDVTRPEYAQVITAQEAVTRTEQRESDLFFDPSLRYALGLLMTNERSDAAAYRPMFAGENAAAAARLRRVDWNDYPYSALLVFGHGPEDAQSRTGVMGHLRLRLAADRFRRGQAPVIILSGGTVHPNRTPFNEAIEMRDELVQLYAVPAERILMEPYARHTTTNLRNIARLLLTAPFPKDKAALILSDPETIAYIGSPTLAERNRAELGYLPGTIAAGPDAMALSFHPDPLSFHVDPQDPLDP